MALLNHVLDSKSFKAEGETLIINGERQQELEEIKIEVALIKDDGIKEEIDTRVSPQLLLLHSLWKEIVQTTFVVLTSMCRQIFKAYLGISIIHVKMNSLIMQTTREEKSVLPILTQGKSLLVSSFFKEEDTCSLFLVGDPYCDLKKKYF